MPFIEELLIKLLPTLVPMLQKALAPNPAGTTPIDQVREHLGSHLQWVSGWSTAFRYFLMRSPKSIDQTIALSLSDLPRRLRNVSSGWSILSESDLLARSGHCLILGDPGSGKTTMLQRLCRRLLECDSDGQESWSYPVVLLGRSMDPLVPLHKRSEEHTSELQSHSFI